MISNYNIRSGIRKIFFALDHNEHQAKYFHKLRPYPPPGKSILKPILKLNGNQKCRHKNEQRNAKYQGEMYFVNKSERCKNISHCQPKVEI
jgi:hypothetical protein